MHRDDSHSESADTGTAVHAAVQSWHASGDVEKALAEVTLRLPEFPLADLGDAGEQFRAYAADPRNAVRLHACEKEITCRIAGEAGEEPLIIHGTLDQLRMDRDGCLSVWDVKTTGKSVMYALHAYTYQIAAYTVGAKQTFGLDTRPGGVIRTRAYLLKKNAGNPSPDGVFIEMPWGFTEAERLLRDVQTVVRHVRNGTPWVVPGEHCMFCPARGIDVCLPQLHKEIA